MTDPTEIVVYEGSDDWSALYVRGELLEVGDHYWVQEKLLQVLGIETIQSDDFLRGGNERSDVAQTLDELEEYRGGQLAREAASRVAEAEAKVAEAQRELDGARALAAVAVI